MNKGSWFSHASSKPHAKALAKAELTPRSEGAQDPPVDPFDALEHEYEAARLEALREEFAMIMKARRALRCAGARI